MIVLSQCWSCGLTVGNISFQISLCARAYLPVINEKNKDMRRDLYGGKKEKLSKGLFITLSNQKHLSHTFVKQMQNAVKNNL